MNNQDNTPLPIFTPSDCVLEKRELYTDIPNSPIINWYYATYEDVDILSREACDILINFDNEYSKFYYLNDKFIWEYDLHPHINCNCPNCGMSLIIYEKYIYNDEEVWIGCV
jgi:hypothetical protein